MSVDRIRLREIHLPLLWPFETSFGVTDNRKVLLIEIQSQDKIGWGECVAGEGPFYSYETVETAWSILTGFLIPTLLQEPQADPQRVPFLWSFVRGHHMAKASLEAAVWDLAAKQKGIPLWKFLGGERRVIPAGVSIGIQPDLETLLEKIRLELQAGYRKIKLKIKPGWDCEVVSTVREHYPDIPLMVDANSAYQLSDAPHLKELDQFSLIMIEQPLAHDDFLDHSRLQSELSTPICLDESIRHSRDARQALDCESCRVINIKMGRLGGYGEALGVHDLCWDRDVPVWCGGMLETGIGRAHNVALSSLRNFSIPGDVSASRRYFERDTVVPPVEVNSDGFIQVPEHPGIGYEPDLDWIQHLTVRSLDFRP